MTKDDIRLAVEGILGADMLPTIACESGFRQYHQDGTVLRSGTSDVGITQINVDTWGLKAIELGYDIYTPLGNLNMAKYILSVQGPDAWVCHKKLMTYNA